MKKKDTDKTREDRKKIKSKKKEERKKKREEKRETRDYVKIKRVSRAIMMICILIIVIEVVAMLIKKTEIEADITFIDSLNSIVNVDNKYYIAAGSSNFRHSNYNNSFTYEYKDAIYKNKINKVYAEQAKLVKYDSEMNIVFEKTFKGKYDSAFYDVKVGKDFIIAVGSYVYEEEQLPIHTRDGLIVKYDLDGKVIWSKNYQVLGDTEFKSVILEDDGIVVVGQSIYEQYEFGTHPYGGGIIVKYDYDGNVLWKNNYGGNKTGIFESVVSVSDGYIVCGKNETDTGIVLKFDKECNLLWNKDYKSSDTYGFYDIKLKDEKLYIATGIKENNMKYTDAGILVYNLNGDLEKTFKIGGSLDDRFNSLMLLEDKIVAVGFTNSKDIKINDLNYQKGYAEGMIVTFDYEGKVLNSIAYGGSKNDVLTDIDIAIKDQTDKMSNTIPYILSGYTNSKRGLFKGNGKDYYSRILKYNDKLELLIEK